MFPGRSISSSVTIKTLSSYVKSQQDFFYDSISQAPNGIILDKEQYCQLLP